MGYNNQTQVAQGQDLHQLRCAHACKHVICSLAFMLKYYCYTVNLWARPRTKASSRDTSWPTHVASKLAPGRVISLVPCPADQFSSILKSVHWYCIDPILPSQPFRQVRLSPPRSVAAATVFSSQSPPSVEFLRQAMR